MAAKTEPSPDVVAYSAAARAFHWITALLIVVMFVTGKWMTERGGAGIWDATTNNLYSTHKLTGFLIIWLVLLRLAYRLLNGAPPEPATLSPVQKLASSVVHWSVYALLLVVPLTGWIGTSMFPALNVFGLFDLPSIASADKAASETWFSYHHLAGQALFVLVAVHIGAAIMHAVVFKDGVFQRMWPRRSV